MKRSLHLILALGFLAACGEKEGPLVSVSFTGEDAFSDPSVYDLVFRIDNVPTTAGMLDLNRDGTPDTFIYPTACGTTFPRGCGVIVAEGGTVSLGQLPLGFRYSVQARFRDSGVTPTDLYSGSVEFANDGATTQIEITLEYVYTP
jgi:hypothetical protein